MRQNYAILRPKSLFNSIRHHMGLMGVAFRWVLFNYQIGSRLGQITITQQFPMVPSLTAIIKL